MSRLISLVVLLVVLTAVGVVFYQVMAGFLVPLFLAVLLVVVFRPVHQWYMDRCGGRGHLAAGLTTATILIAVLVPLGVVMVQAAREGVRIARDLGAAGEFGKRPVDKAGDTSDSAAKSAADDAIEPANHPAPAPATDGEQKNGPRSPLHALIAQSVDRLGLPVTEEEQRHLADATLERLQSFAQPLIVGGAQIAARTLLGLVVMIVSIYFFLLDGPQMIDSIIAFIPLDAAHTQQLFSRFVNVSRAIVTATLLSAVVQGILAGFAYRIAGLDSVFLLMSLTMLLAMIPFVGAVSVWLPCCLWLFFQHENTVAAVGLGIFGTAIISQADNVIKPYVLHGQSNLHPLLALLSVLGGVQALGPIGIVVGPMAVAFLQTLLTMVRTEIGHFDAGAATGHDGEGKSPGKRLSAADAHESKSLRPLLKRIRMMVTRNPKKRKQK
ncbi:MAG: AI-2E family transporter [Pirellulales bacterium]